LICDSSPEEGTSIRDPLFRFPNDIFQIWILP
jgi:hypothetical protein